MTFTRKHMYKEFYSCTFYIMFVFFKYDICPSDGTQCQGQQPLDMQKTVPWISKKRAARETSKFHNLSLFHRFDERKIGTSGSLMRFVSTKISFCIGLHGTFSTKIDKCNVVFKNLLSLYPRIWNILTGSIKRRTNLHQWKNEYITQR